MFICVEVRRAYDFRELGVVQLKKCCFVIQ